MSASIDIQRTCDEIRVWHRQRVYAMGRRMSDDLKLGAFLRTQLGWSRELPADEAKKITQAVEKFLKLGEKYIIHERRCGKKGVDSVDFDTWLEDLADTKIEPRLLTWVDTMMASMRARQPMADVEDVAVKQMERLAKMLPVWAEFGEGVKGFGAPSLAVIIGETGNLSNYATIPKLWKRMGLAVMNGVRQGGLPKTAKAEDWIAHGYNAKRRSQMFVIGDVLIKFQGVYREHYLVHKAIERQKAEEVGLTVAPAAKIPAKFKDDYKSEGHIHKCAQRWMEKRFLRDLWGAWRRTIVELSETTSKGVSDASISFKKAA